MWKRLAYGGQILNLDAQERKKVKPENDDLGVANLLYRYVEFRSYRYVEFRSYRRCVQNRLAGE